jgi:ATP-dependent DNA ligase
VGPGGPRPGAAHRRPTSPICGDGAIIFRRALQTRAKGIVSKRLGSPYRSGRSEHWLKIKNPSAPGRAARGGRGLERQTEARS